MAAAGTTIGELVPADLDALLRTHPLVLRRPVLGRRHGRHPSARAGVGLDFRDHRPYTPGDDPRQLDWRAVARRDRLVLRQTEAEDELTLVLALDAGANMDYGEGSSHKYRAARALLAALAWAAIRQGDRVGLAVAGDGGLDVSLLRPGAGPDRLDAIARVLGRTAPRGRAPLQRLPDAIAPRLPPRSLVVLATDWLDLADDRADADANDQALLQGLSQLRARRHDVVVLQVLHRDEREFPWHDHGVLRFVDPRTLRADVEGAATAMRAGYLARIGAHLDAIARGCEHHGVLHQSVHSEAALAPAFVSLLARLGGQAAPVEARP